MATSRRKTKVTPPIVTEEVKEVEEVEENTPVVEETTPVVEEKVEEKVEEATFVEELEKTEAVAMPEPEEKPKKTKKAEPAPKIEEKPTPKYRIGSVVFVSKDAQADLNGFKLFPPYKKYTYTVEAYDDVTGVYSLRRLNLSLKLKEADIVAPHEKSGDSLTRRQF